VDAEKHVLKVQLFSDQKDPVPLGVVEFPFEQILETPFVDDWFPVMNPDNPVCFFPPPLSLPLLKTNSRAWPIEGSWDR